MEWIMNFETRKLNVINWLLHLEDEKTLKKIETMLRSDKDWWDDISETEKEAIREGIAELDRGEGIPHKQVMQEINKKLKRS